MAISMQRLDHGNKGTAGQTTTTNSISPAANSLLFLVSSARAASAPAAPTATGLSLSWLPITNQNRAIGGAIRGRVLQAQCGASPGSGAVTLDWGASVDASTWSIIEVTGHNTSSAIVQSPATGTNTGTALSTTLAAFADTNNAGFTWAVHGSGTGSLTPEAGWTELSDDVNNASANGSWCAWRIGEDQSPTATLSASVVWVLGSVEIAIAPAAGATAQSSTRRRQAIRRRRG